MAKYDPTTGMWRCSQGLKAKPREHFGTQSKGNGRPLSRCRVCVRVWRNVFMETATPEQREALKKQEAEARRRYYEAHRDRKRAETRAYFATEIGRLVNIRNQVRRRRKKATDEFMIEYYDERDRELTARIESLRGQDSGTRKRTA